MDLFTLHILVVSFRFRNNHEESVVDRYAQSVTFYRLFVILSFHIFSHLSKIVFRYSQSGFCREFHTITFYDEMKSNQ